MEMRVLGRSGVRVSAYCLGAMMFGKWGNPDHDDCIAMMHASFDAGINFVDTADVYSAGESEEIVGKAIRGRRDDVVIATKFMGVMGDAPNMGDGSRRWIVRACEDSLRRLGTDHIDLYQMHRPSLVTDLDESLGALSDLVHQGKVRMIGHSTFPADLIVEAQWTAERRGRERFVSEQPPYSVLMRGIERFVLPACERYGIGVIPWSPLAGGLLGGAQQKAREGRRAEERMQKAIDKHHAQLEAYEAFCAARGEQPADVALAWMLHNPAITAPIIGPRTMAQLDGSLAALEIKLDEAALKRLDEIWPGPGGAAPEAYAW